MLFEWLLELESALSAAGLDARVTFAPDRGPGVVIGAPSGVWDDHAPRTACGDLTRADVTLVVHVIAHGWAPEQLAEQLADMETVLTALPEVWRPAGFEPAPGDVTLPEYRVTIAR